MIIPGPCARCRPLGGYGLPRHERLPCAQCPAARRRSRRPRAVRPGGAANMGPALSRSSHGMNVTRQQQLSYGLDEQALTCGDVRPTNPGRPPFVLWGSRGRRFKSCRPDVLSQVGGRFLVREEAASGVCRGALLAASHGSCDLTAGRAIARHRRSITLRTYCSVKSDLLLSVMGRAVTCCDGQLWPESSYLMPFRALDTGTEALEDGRTFPAEPNVLVTDVSSAWRFCMYSVCVVFTSWIPVS